MVCARFIQAGSVLKANVREQMLAAQAAPHAASLRTSGIVLIPDSLTSDVESYPWVVVQAGCPMLVAQFPKAAPLWSVFDGSFRVWDCEQWGHRLGVKICSYEAHWFFKAKFDKLLLLYPKRFMKSVPRRRWSYSILLFVLPKLCCGPFCQEVRGICKLIMFALEGGMT